MRDNSRAGRADPPILGATRTTPSEPCDRNCSELYQQFLSFLDTVRTSDSIVSCLDLGASAPRPIYTASRSFFNTAPHTVPSARNPSTISSSFSPSCTYDISADMFGVSRPTPYCQRSSVRYASSPRGGLSEVIPGVRPLGQFR